MALQKTIVTPQGFDAIDAYHRVESVVLKSKDEISFNVCSYKDNAAMQSFEIKRVDCAYDLNTSNPIAQAYEHLKTLPEFADAVDC